MDTLNKKILYENEFEILNFIKTIEPLIFEFITNIFILLKNNEHIYHINNYDNFDFTNNDDIKNNIPLMILLGGSSYLIYSKLFNQYYNKDIINIDENLINSIDYDFSIMVNQTFDKDKALKIINDIINGNIDIIIKLNNIVELDVIYKNDIQKNIFLKRKHIINEDYNKLLITLSHSKDYIGIQFTLKYKNNFFQIIELLFWYNYTISENISISDFTKNKCILYKTDDFKILLPNLTMLIKSNIMSMKSRITTHQFNKCTKDYYRIKYIKLIYDFINNDNKNIKDVIINKIILDTQKIYEKNINIFKLPYSICSLNNTDDDKKLLYELYSDFLNLSLKKQINIMLNNIEINEEKKNKIKSIKI
jgi:hypothetical protein